MNPKTRAALLMLKQALHAVESLPRLLAEYETTGDHNHGKGSIPVGRRCGMGDDCIVGQTRLVIAKLNVGVLPVYNCLLCGQYIDDGKPCGCGAR